MGGNYSIINANIKLKNSYENWILELNLLTNDALRALNLTEHKQRHLDCTKLVKH